MAETLSSESLAKRGKSEYGSGNHLAAAKTFEAANQAYLSAGEALMAAEMANNASVAYLQAGEAEAALSAVEGTATIFAEAQDACRQGMALGNRAAALEALERFEEAIEAYQQSADVLEQAGEDQLRSNVLNSLSMLQFRMGRQLQALASMQNGLEGVKKPSPRQRFLKQLLNIPFQMMNRGNKS